MPDPLPSVSREVHLIRRPAGQATVSNFAVTAVAVRPPQPGEILVRNSWLSVDPYMRGRMNDVESYVAPFPLDAPLEGGAVGTVLASDATQIPVGSVVLHNAGWREVATVAAEEARVVDASRAPARMYLGVLGMTGLTAYIGLTEIAPVRDGDIVFISGAAGAVGTVAARVARELGATTIIGSAGGSAKAQRLIEEFGFDAAIDYTAGPLHEQLSAAAPEGIDVYFDSVGADHLRAALAVMRRNGRIALCGAIASYDSDTASAIDNLFLATGKRITLRGYLVIDHYDRWDEYVTRALGWLDDGSLRYEETVAEGIDQAASAFIGLLHGRNAGKMLVRVGPEAHLDHPS
jgi:NADPH-dependent curcumin reductase CurA